MSMMFKYRVHEVAKDFKLPTKAVSEILTEYSAAPKNHMQVLTVEELDLIFEYLTQQNQIDSIEEVYAVESPSAVSAPEAPKSPEKTPGESAAAPGRKASEQKKAAPEKPAHSQKPEHQQQQPARKPDKPFVPRQVPQKRVVDTSGATINIDKYDERLDKLVPERAEHMARGKEKFSRKSQNRTP
ncbi:MAG: translation initiation factor IF-2, partial [Clostridiales bacterium]|nr:translation initiation factor IF-2 [Clostridiales bacterium]